MDHKHTRAARTGPQGLILYRGPSLLNGAPVVCVATCLVKPTSNDKTGDFIQTYVLADGDERPTDAIRSGADAAVCGDCPHRSGSCYVDAGRAPNAVFEALRRGRYPRFRPRRHLPLFAGRLVRLGAYGDPAAVPLRVWEAVCGVAAGWTGYTHAWRVCAPGYARFCMASVETEAQREQAAARGYRTFRVRLPEQPVGAGEFICPSSAEAGRRLSCADCLACSGTGGRRKASPVIVVHGLHWKVGAYRRHLQEFEGGRVALPLL
jgi:hypothetical protein